MTTSNNIFTRDSDEAFEHAISTGYLINERDSYDALSRCSVSYGVPTLALIPNYVGHFMYMNSEHLDSHDIDCFKNKDTKEYLWLHSLGKDEKGYRTIN